MASNSNFICIREAPTKWNKGLIQGMFSQYGPIEEITVVPNVNPKTNFVIVEFECDEDATGAVEDHKGSYPSVTFYSPTDPTAGSTMVIPSALIHVPPPVQAFHCANANCTNEFVVKGQCVNFDLKGGDVETEIYCSQECYCEYKDMKGRVNIYDKYLRSLGRSGTRMLKRQWTRTLVDIKITVDSEGVRRSEMTERLMDLPFL